MIVWWPRLLTPLSPLSPAPSGQVEVMVTVERCQLWKYSVWDREELQERGLGWEVKGEMGQPPPALLLLYVSDAQAVAVQEDLRELSIKQALEPPTGESLPFGTKLCVSVARYTKTSQLFFFVLEYEKWYSTRICYFQYVCQMSHIY